MPTRFTQNPILNTKDIQPSQPSLVVECVLNPGVFSFDGKTWLLLRVAERPVQKEGMISFPVMNMDGGYTIMEFDKSDPDLDLSDARMVNYKNKTGIESCNYKQWSFF